AEIILTRAADADDRGHRPLYDGNSRSRAVFLDIFKLLGAQQDSLAHNFAGLELYGCPRGNYHVVLRLVGVASDTRLRQAHFENAEIAKLDILSLGEGFGNIIQSFLDRSEEH